MLCGGSTALFFFFGWSEPGTGARPSLQKMWRVDRAFFLGVSEPLFSLFPSFSTLFPSLSLSLPLFPLFLTSFYLFFTFFYIFFISFSIFFPLFFALFHIFFSVPPPFSHYFPFFPFFPFLFRILFRIFVGLAAAAALPPYLAFPYLTSHYISSPLLP